MQGLYSFVACLISNNQVICFMYTYDDMALTIKMYEKYQLASTVKTGESRDKEIKYSTVSLLSS